VLQTLQRNFFRARLPAHPFPRRLTDGEIATAIVGGSLAGKFAHLIAEGLPPDFFLAAHPTV
jgi:hypothetical protein